MERYTYDEDIIRLELSLIFLLDTSESMHGERIKQLNLAMSKALRLAEKISIDKEVIIPMRVVQFNTDAEWIYGNAEQGVRHIDWKDLTAGGTTNTAAAIDKAIEVMHRSILGTRNYKPVVILITDGMSNDPGETLQAIERLKKRLKGSRNPNADKIIRIALGVAEANQDELRAFASVGDIVDADGTEEKDVPFVFNVNDDDLLRNILLGNIVRIPPGIPPEPIVWDPIKDDEDDEDDWEI